MRGIITCPTVSIDRSQANPKGRNFTTESFDIVADFGNKVECCFDKVERCFDNVACCFDIVAGVDGTLVDSWSSLTEDGRVV